MSNSLSDFFGVYFDFWGKTLFAFSHVFPVILFPLLMGGVFVLIMSKLLGSRRGVAESIGRGIVFGIIGLVVAYLTVRGKSSVETLLPHVIIGVTVSAQLVGSMSSKLKAPVGAQESLIGAATAGFMFFFGSIYFEQLYPTESLLDVDQTKTVGTP